MKRVIWMLGSNGYSSLYLDGFWSHGVGNEGTIRIADEEGA